jgi:hypothetical protein
LSKNYIKLDDRFSISADTFNIILKDKERNTNNGYSFHSNVEQVLDHIIYTMEKEAVVVGQPTSSNKVLHVGSWYASITRLKQEITLTIEKKLKQLKKDLE